MSSYTSKHFFDNFEKNYLNEKQLRILSLYLSDYNAKFHLRKIAREVKTDTKTISINLKRLEKLGVIISEKVGKHKEFILNFKNPFTTYFLINAHIILKGFEFFVDSTKRNYYGI